MRKNYLTITVFFMAALCAMPAFSANFNVIAENWPHAIMGLLGGITFLLYGLEKMTSSFKALAGDKLKLVLGKLTKTKVSALATGAITTAIVQSSAATTVMVVGFISAKLMTLPQSLAVILGADIGTTITVQLIAFKLNQYALIFIILGFLIKNFSKKESIWQLGRVIMAIGIVFFGIFLIGESMALLQNLPIVQHTITHIENPISGIILGFLMTALMHSSAASLAIVIAVADQGMLTIPAAFYLLLGANIGSCVTAAIASLKSTQDGQRAAIAHAFFKVSGVIVFISAFLIFKDWFIQHIIMLDPKGVATAERAVPRQIAHMHTIFNITIALVYLPFVDLIAKALTHIIKTKRKKFHLEAIFLDTFLLSTPSLALNAARSEVAHMATHVSKLMRETVPAVLNGNIDELAKLKQRENDIDALYDQIIEYLGQVGTSKLSANESLYLVWLMNSVNRLENISDLLGEELYEVGKKRQKGAISMNKQTRDNIQALADRTVKALRYSCNAISAFEAKLGKNASAMEKEPFQKLMDKIMRQQVKRLSAQGENRSSTYSIEMDIVDKLQRIFYHSRKMAKDTLKLLEQRESLKSKKKQNAQKSSVEAVSQVLEDEPKENTLLPETEKVATIK